MEVAKQTKGDELEIRLNGRLDNYWSTQLASELEEAVRQGHHRIRLIMAGTTYMSSAGIRILLACFKKLKALNGYLVVTDPSVAVQGILHTAGMKDLFCGSTVTAPEQERAVRKTDGVSYKSYPLGGGPLFCRIHGDASRVEQAGYTAQDISSLSVDRETFSIGLGAFGDGFDDCKNRFGEYLAAAGTAVYQPTDGTDMPDYQVASGSFTPAIQSLYGITFKGSFPLLIRFDTESDLEPVTLSTLVKTALELCGTTQAGLVLLAESAGLVGASLRRSPVLNSATGKLFSFPEVRTWLSFTPERAYKRALACVVGVASMANASALEPLTRPLGPGTQPTGHFHAGVFSYRAIPKGAIPLRETLATLFEQESLQNILHLLYDGREISGAGESAFFRGALWVGPLGEIQKEAS